MTKQFSVSIEPDEHGMIGRQCPQQECGLYFKLKLETGWGTEVIRCPYCHMEGHPTNFVTPDQLEYAKSVALKNLVEPMLLGFKKDVERLNRNQARGLLELKFSVNYKPISLHRYLEQQLETEVHCDICTLDFSVYGIFASCPCCGQLNALKVLLSSLDTATKKLRLSEVESLELELREDFVKDALTGSVSAFDAYGKALMKSRPHVFRKTRSTLFQDVESLDRHLQSQGIPPLEQIIGCSAWEDIKWFFQARHIHVHNAGVIDERFVSKQPHFAQMWGRLLPLDVKRLTQNIEVLGLLSCQIDQLTESNGVPS